MSSGKSLIFKRKKTHLEESMCSGGLGLDSFSDDLLKFRANVSAAVEEYETNAEDDDAEEAFLPDSTMVQNGTREENFFAKKHTAEDVRSNTHIIIIGNTISLGFLACNTYSTDCATGVHKHVMSAEGRANLHVMRKN
ncbi:hypothetical protein GBAR_LOCUS14340 [Geodia barretti]|uniref:Uncharacterized protein n=1 Tax=Geodia barretti TaxID=519541 RepID=A0AA35WKD9_GEOBA|nr:hypothetical protein GBAR_LOCUS14340 [Geodia barretti]